MIPALLKEGKIRMKKIPFFSDIFIDKENNGLIKEDFSCKYQAQPFNILI